MNGRNKGSTAEREVAALIQKWWRTHSPKANFVRVPLSGGWGNPQTRAGFRASGDIMTDDTTFPFSVEVKRREGWAWKNLLAGGKSPVWDWWFQAQDQAKEMNLTPMLWLRHSREPWMVMLPENCNAARVITCREVASGFGHPALPRLQSTHWWSKEIWQEKNVGTNPMLVTASLILDTATKRFIL